jgi:hypothetical protein
MMISNEQVRLAVEYLRTSDEYGESVSVSGVAPRAEFVSRVVDSLSELPDVREDRVAHARLLTEDGMPSSDELATKLIGRVVSDAIR